jgi:Rod binding domain-containing protein
MSGISAIDQSLLPADVRKGSSTDRKTYAAALDFERSLVTELTKVMAETAKPADDDDQQQQDPAASMYQQQMPDQLASAVMQGGGIGLARSLYDSMKEGQ